MGRFCPDHYVRLAESSTFYGPKKFRSYIRNYLIVCLFMYQFESELMPCPKISAKSITNWTSSGWTASAHSER